MLVIRCCQLSHGVTKFWYRCLCKPNYLWLWLYRLTNSTLGDGAWCLHDVLPANLNLFGKPLWTHHAYHDGLRGTVSVRFASNSVMPLRLIYFMYNRSIVGTIVLMIVSNTNTATQAGLLICYYLVVSFWGAQTLSLSLLTRNVGGQTKKSVATAMNFIFWAAGNAIGKDRVKLSTEL